MRTHRSLLQQLLPGLRDLVALGVDGGRVVGVDGGQARRLAVQRRHLVLQRRQVALHALVLALRGRCASIGVHSERAGCEQC